MSEQDGDRKPTPPTPSDERPARQSPHDPEERREPRPQGPGGFNNEQHPQGQGGYNNGPRPQGQGGYNNGPRPQGQGGYNNGPRPQGQGGYNNGPRPQGQGGYNNGPRPQGQGGYNNGPRPQGPGGYNNGPRPQGPGGYNNGPRPQGQGGYNNGPRPQGPGGPGGPRPQGGPGGNRPFNGPRPQGGPGGRPSGPGGFGATLPPPPSTGFGRAGNTPARNKDKDKPGSKPTYGRDRDAEANKNGRKGGHNQRGRSASGGSRSAQQTKVPTGPVELPPTIVVKDLAELLEATPNRIITKLIGFGIFANINQTIDYETAAKIAVDLGYEAVEKTLAPAVSAVKSEAIVLHSSAVPKEQRSLRPPVVTVMGHVDHGKTSLLDAIRKTKVAAGEAGGITQHIGAYQVKTTDGRPVTFLDTPGHEAFTAMRARGAKVTDIAIIVVAADDGVMPQTLEAIDHARAAQVPLVIALNKIDKENANPDYVKQQLAEHNVVIEEYGGEVVCVPVSAKKGIGIEELLEMILLVADVQDLEANAEGEAVGTVLEASIDKNSGVVANILVQDGTLHVGDIIVVGMASTKVRAMFSDTGKRIREAGPSLPVSILGLSDVPTAGDHFTVVPDERSARQLIEQHKNEAADARAVVTLDTLYQQMQQGKVRELNLLLKADVQGSMDALHQVLSKLGTEQFKVRLIHEGVGNISETDVHLAAASHAIIIGFNTQPDNAAQRMAQSEHVDIRFYDVIYKLVDDIDAALKGMLEPVYKDVVEGHAEVLATFKSGKTVIGGCRVTDGKLTRSAAVRVLRGGKEVFKGTIASLRRGKDDAREVLTGFECGVTLDGFNDVQIGDIIETTIKVRV